MCYSPFIKEDAAAGCIYTLPCGKCPQCVNDRINGWIFRLQQELKHATSADFLTLTYDTGNIPINEHSYPTLVKKDIQDFMKRLRKKHSQKLIYFACGEYGDKTQRPHYHMILFNARQDLIQPVWGLGNIHYGTVTPNSIAYTLKYINKRSSLKPSDFRQKEFVLMSKYIGQHYLKEQNKQWHKADLTQRMYLPLEDGKKVAMPRYYKNKIYDEDERIIIARESNIRQSLEIEKITNSPDFEKIERDKQQAILAAFKRQKYHSQKQDKL